MRFGQQALDEIVGMVRDGGQEVQLHLHTEWVDEAREPLWPGPQRKRQHLRYFSCEEQTTLIAKGLELLRRDSGVSPGLSLVEPITVTGVHEYPMMVYRDGTTKLRHAQLTACSSSEMEGLLWQAVAQQRKAFVILSHGFELLNQAKDRADDVMVKRFQRLCALLDKNRDSFRVTGFQGLASPLAVEQPGPLTSPLRKTGARMVEQLYRRKFG